MQITPPVCVFVCSANCVQLNECMHMCLNCVCVCLSDRSWNSRNFGGGGEIGDREVCLPLRKIHIKSHRRFFSLCGGMFSVSYVDNYVLRTWTVCLMCTCLSCIYNSPHPELNGTCAYMYTFAVSKCLAWLHNLAEVKNGPEVQNNLMSSGVYRLSILEFRLMLTFCQRQ